MEQFTPINGLVGGVLIGLSAALLLLGNGRVAGISGILGGVCRKDFWWRIVFLICMCLGGGLYMRIQGDYLVSTLPVNYILLIVAGLLVGFGTRLGGGCTSGHGVCGLSRLSFRSFFAVMVFMVSACVVVYLVRHVI